MTSPTTDPRAGLLDTEERTSIAVPEATGPARLSSGAARALWAGVGALAACVALSYAVGRLSWARPWVPGDGYVPFWNLIGRELLGEGERAAAEQQEIEALQDLARAVEAEPAAPREDRPAVEPPTAAVYPPYVDHADDREPLVRPLEFAEALAPFYAALSRTDLGYARAVTRAGHWGDSVLGLDGITAAVRRRMQARFGDAGHGYHSLSQYNASYRQQGVHFSERGEWQTCAILYGCRRDGHYGYGGVTVSSAGGAETRLSTVDDGPFGRKVSRFELFYAGQPRGGRLRLRVDDGEDRVLETAAVELEDRFERIEVSDGAHRLSVRAVGGGKVRAYGVVLEREGPGVVWDGLAIIGSFVSRLSNFDPGHLERHLARREVDLLVFTFGGNDMLDTSLLRDMGEHERKYGAVVRMFRAARPRAACLLVSPVDHGERRGGRIVSLPIVAPMVEAQRSVARAEGCAFFDLFSAMGGEGSMGRWSRAHPRLGSGDLRHPTSHGHAVIGAMLYGALVRGYADFRRRVAGQPLP